MTRRTLTTVGFPALLAAQTPSDEIRVAFIGVGTRGSFLHRTMLKIPNAKIAAIADLDDARAQQAAALAREAGHNPAVYADFRKMLAELKDIDAVIIATPVDTHAGIAAAVLEAGKHVYLEKPVALTPEQCTLVEKAAQNAKGILQIGFQSRHDPARAASTEFIHSGKLGKVIYLHAHRHTGDLPRNTPWYFDAKRSGDNIVEQACHILDLMTWAAGSPPARAYGSGGISLYHDIPPGRTTMDNYSVLYEWTNGLRLNFSHMYFDPPGFSGIKERVYGSEGAIELPAAVFYPLGREKERVKLEVPTDKADANTESLKAFLDNARGRKRPLNNIQSAKQSTLVAILGRTAIYEKRIVEWKEVAG
jgi:predicted dehydrogenase